MNSYLKQSTASQTRATPPFLDDTDFKTAETGLTIANTDVKLMKNGGSSANKNSGGGTHLVNGAYALTFDATDTDTVGELFVSIKVAGALPVFFSYWVLEEAIYDALFGASAAGYGTAQTGDSFARLGAPAGASVSADIAAIEAQTDDIGAAGAGLTNVPWNAAWDAEVQSEAADALTAFIIEGAITLRQAIGVVLDSQVGKTVDMETTTAKIRNIADTLDRITATVDGDNRTAVTLDLTGLS